MDAAAGSRSMSSSDFMDHGQAADADTAASSSMDLSFSGPPGGGGESPDDEGGESFVDAMQFVDAALNTSDLEVLPAVIDLCDESPPPREQKMAAMSMEQQVGRGLAARINAPGSRRGVTKTSAVASSSIASEDKGCASNATESRRVSASPPSEGSGGGESKAVVGTSGTGTVQFNNARDDVDVASFAAHALLPPPILGEYDVLLPVVPSRGLMILVGRERETMRPVFGGYVRYPDGKPCPAEAKGLIRKRGDILVAVNGSYLGPSATYHEAVSILTSAKERDDFVSVRFREFDVMDRMSGAALAQQVAAAATFCGEKSSSPSKSSIHGARVGAAASAAVEATFSLTCPPPYKADVSATETVVKPTPVPRLDDAAPTGDAGAKAEKPPLPSPPPDGVASNASSSVEHSAPSASVSVVTPANAHKRPEIKLPIALESILPNADLSDYHTALLRSVELFKLTDQDEEQFGWKRDDPAADAVGGQEWTALGVRCTHCKNLPLPKRRTCSVKVPSCFQALPSLVDMIGVIHLSACHKVPDSLAWRLKLERRFLFRDNRGVSTTKAKAEAGLVGLDRFIELVAENVGMENVRGRVCLKRPSEESVDSSPAQIGSSGVIDLTASPSPSFLISTKASGGHTLQKGPPVNLTKPSAPKPKKKNGTNKKKDSKPRKLSKADLDLIAVLENPPRPGFVDKSTTYYATINNETCGTVAEKLGSEWRDIATLKQNTDWYGTLLASSIFKTGTILQIPQVHSRWKVQHMIDNADDVAEALQDSCCECKRSDDNQNDKENHPNPHRNDNLFLLCDGCDVACHLRCAGLDSVPEGDWFCRSCLDVLRARRATHGVGINGNSLLASLSPLPPPRTGGSDAGDAEAARRVELASRLRLVLHARRDDAHQTLAETYQSFRSSLKHRVVEIQREVNDKKRALMMANDKERQAARVALAKHGMEGFGGTEPTMWIMVKGNHASASSKKLRQREEGEEVPLPNARWRWQTRTVYTDRWLRAVHKKNTVLRDRSWKNALRRQSQLEEELKGIEGTLDDTLKELASSNISEKMERTNIDLEFAALLDEPRLQSETAASYEHRECVPRLLGYVTPASDADVHGMNMLCEPDELVIFLPVQEPGSTSVAGWHRTELEVGATYAVFARSHLFDQRRDDETPVDRNGLRDAQRRLMSLLEQDATGDEVVVNKTKIPSSVKVRGEEVGGCDEIDKYFDLSELVRDCNVGLDLPLEQTPSEMADNGLQLRVYQQASLRWMLDKESETVGMGIAWELWQRRRFMDLSSLEYFYCELTGSLSLSIFDFRKDADQMDAALNFGGMPTGSILGEEMGLGKTVICLALVVANPPPLSNRVLPREHLWSIEKHTVNHPDFMPPPRVTVKESSPSVLLSNATLVVVPMTLMSQWQSEIERYTPWLNVLTLHNSENPKHQTIASADVVIVSTWLLQQGGTKGGQKSKRNGNSLLLSYIRRTHWHRIFVDESHYNQSGSKIKLTLSSLSSTHRHCVTGTPIGHSLDDLHGQLRFLRIAPFNRDNFWKNVVGDPYYAHNGEALRILRSLLSHVVIRHSKEQKLSDGEALVSLPPRTVETALIPFGSEAELDVYNAIDKRNRDRFLDFRSESTATLRSKYFDLIGMLCSARQACSHISMIDLTKFDRINRSLDPKFVDRWYDDHSVVDHGKKATRQTVLQQALKSSRISAQTRVREIILQFQNGDGVLVECPVCLEPVGEAEIAITPCGHPFCSECALNVLNAASSFREASGRCPQCRDTIRRSEITFLGEASEAGTSNSTELEGTGKQQGEEKEKPTTVDSMGFKYTSQQVHVAVSGSSTHRAGVASESRTQLDENKDAASLPTLSSEFLKNYHRCKGEVGTKVARLLEEIKIMAEKDPKSKCVVFSQFLGSLNVVGEELTARGIRFVRIDGTVKQHERADALLDFASENIKVFLLSMRSGAVGLNLVAADHCFILDTPQNSAIEEQAIDRVHRIGQLRPVTVKRFVMQGTVEERILHIRRSIGADKPVTSTQLCDASLMGGEEETTQRPAKRSRQSFGGLGEVNERQQQRLENLAVLFGCSLCPTILKA